jgi:hypothetical protein
LPVFDDAGRRFVEAGVKLGRLLPWLGVAASALLLVNVNVLGARWYKRWDFTSDRLYTLSGPTRELLAGLKTPIDVAVLLTKADPLSVSVRHMLEAYGAETRQLRVRYVDPDRSPAEFLAVQQKYQILAGKTEDGRVITDAVIVFADQDKHWFVTADELVHLDEESGRTRPALEQTLSNALDNVRRTERAKLCFTTGHREPTLEDLGPEGLSELKKRLLKNNYDVESVDASSPKASFGDCVTVVVPTPELPFGSEDANRLADYVRNGGSALLLLGPTLGDALRVSETGLEPVLGLCGVSLGRDVVLEQDSAQRLPSGSGELFWAKLLPHPVTRGLLHEDDKLSSRVLVAKARSVKPNDGATSVMESSGDAIALEDLGALADDSRRARALQASKPGRFVVAAARELAKPAAGAPAHGARLFVTGASNLAWNRNFQDPSLYGNQRLIENAISWAAARPSMLNVPEKPEREIGLSLSEDSISEVRRYVLLYMPVSAGLIAAFVLLRRRNSERQSRKRASSDGTNDKAPS